MSVISEISIAIQDEIKAIRFKYRKSPIVVEHLNTTRVGSYYYYEGVISSFEDGDLLSIPEGIGIKVLYRDWNSLMRQWIEHRRDGKLLYYNLVNHHIIFSVPGEIIDLPERQKQFRIEPTAEDLAMALQEQLPELVFRKDALSWQILDNRFESTSPKYRLSIRAKEFLNESQYSAIEKMFSNDVTFLWGPPGTGKTTTIATAIHEMIRQGKKVLAVSISNIAVDQIALKCLSTGKYPRPSKGEIIRFGYSKLEAVKNEDIFFPSRDIIERLRKEIADLETQLKHISDPLEKAKIRDLVTEKTLALKKATVEPLWHAKATLTTAIQVCLVEEFRELDFDVVIVDEASMLSIAIVAILGKIPKEKLIIAGDYKQLAPIALAETDLAKKWLHRDVFDLAGVTNTFNHPALAMLTQQHRMHEDICEVISDSFYLSQLTTYISDENRIGTNFPPTKGKAREFRSLTPQYGSKVEKLSGQSYSRYNIKTSDVVLELVEKLIKQPGKPCIGIITPYKAQASRLSKLVKELGNKTNNPKCRDVKVGTVHSFQGDESDIIIFDLVDNSEEGPGRLFKGKTGERLMNVAISRAKGKVIIVGDPEIFQNDMELKKLDLLLKKYFLH